MTVWRLATDRDRVPAPGPPHWPPARWHCSPLSTVAGDFWVVFWLRQGRMPRSTPHLPTNRPYPMLTTVMDVFAAGGATFSTAISPCWSYFLANNRLDLVDCHRQHLPLIEADWSDPTSTTGRAAVITGDFLLSDGDIPSSRPFSGQTWMLSSTIAFTILPSMDRDQQ